MKKDSLSGFSGEQISNPVKAIRRYCVGCAHTSSEVELCPIHSCELYPFRFGNNPYRKQQELSAERRGELAERMKKLRENA